MRQTADGDDAGRRTISNSRSTLPKGGEGIRAREGLAPTLTHNTHCKQAASAFPQHFGITSVMSAVSTADNLSTRPPTPFGKQV